MNLIQSLNNIQRVRGRIKTDQSGRIKKRFKLSLPALSSWSLASGFSWLDGPARFCLLHNFEAACHSSRRNFRRQKERKTSTTACQPGCYTSRTELGNSWNIQWKFWSRNVPNSSQWLEAMKTEFYSNDTWIFVCWCLLIAKFKEDGTTKHASWDK